ncbi:MAG TPA: PH domain-containing protein [Phycisphaerae bacterium]|nr:PH domain-containing protein [Phycisphaerae bacterium]HOJ75829.1 PH domain-containing protein [Phycisphaerae bacterium]HOM53215.1 PH domain-containing protein [Phycisphaerae bacterium]HON66688.1 PH domain-containing protein [Phycisphaerae bacterium]HOQ86011.1 PH domain-containing protein [Phycisphaerae bacterium]
MDKWYGDTGHCESMTQTRPIKGTSLPGRTIIGDRDRLRTFQTPFTEHGAAGQLTPANLIPAHLLDGDEIVIFAIKPSLWFILFTSARWLIALAVVIALTAWVGPLVPGVNPPLVIKAALALAAARVGFALLQWVSRLYVLTNRRIMRLRGIFNVDLFECQLNKIQNTFLTLSWYERLVGLGSISFATAGTGGVEASWINLHNPLEVHERVRSAIHRAQKYGNGV